MSAHGCGFEITWRNSDNTEQRWTASCSCRMAWTEPTYEAVEDRWREHVYEVTGTAPKPLGKQEARWSA